MRMLVLFFKSVGEGDSNKEPIADKMRRILESHVDDANTDEDRERAERDLQRLNAADGR